MIRQQHAETLKLLQQLNEMLERRLETAPACPGAPGCDESSSPIGSVKGNPTTEARIFNPLFEPGLRNGMVFRFGDAFSF